MDNKPKLAISIGDLNGVGIEIALKSHEEISKICEPIYCINEVMLNKSAKLLDIQIPSDIMIYETKGEFDIKPGKVGKKSGKYSYDSFIDAIKLTNKGETKAVVTLPINKSSWNKADIKYKGHTEVLRDYFGKHAIMMLGCPKMYVALYTEHIALKKVPKQMEAKKIEEFLLDFQKCVKSEKIAVLALNPHASDDGVLGDEEVEIFKGIKEANKTLKKDIFKGPMVPDTAFSPKNRQEYKYFVAMYHDQGLAPLKALYFEESINVSLNLPIIRTSVDHGTAFDIAYNKDIQKSNLSYINAIKEAINLIK